MWNRFATCIALAAACGCGSRQPATNARAARIEPGIYTIRIAAATIETRRPDGSPWHVRPADDTPTAIGAVAGLAVGNPKLGMKVGAVFADKGGDPEAPIPYVSFKLAGHTWTVAPVERTYSPTWNESIEINARTLIGDELVVIQVLDAVDDALLAQVELPFEKLVASPGQTLTNVSSSVTSVDVQTTWHTDELDHGSYGDRGE